MASSVESSTESTNSGDIKNIFYPTSEAYHLKYEEELLRLFKWTESGKSQLVNLAVTGQLERSRFRSVIWQILLGVLPDQSCQWVGKLRQLRSHYRARKDCLLINLQSVPEYDNPLSRDKSSVWHQYFCDKELRATILKDVVRTSPGDKFFNSERIQSTMVNILFLYAREHCKICYRQGMHELLAPLLLVLDADQQALRKAKAVMSVTGPILEVLDPMCLEEDAYWLLDSLMKHLTCLYSTPDVTPSSTGMFPYQKAKPIESESEVCSRMRRIRDELLGLWDPDLKQHLLELDVPLYFGIRWLRVMFGQEFSKNNLLILWDAIFSANDNFGLVDYIVVAMLMLIRNQLLDKDLIGCLELLAHYPDGVPVHTISRLALHMLKPEKYDQPSDIYDLLKPVAETESTTPHGKFWKEGGFRLIPSRLRPSRLRQADTDLSPTKNDSRRSPYRQRGSRLGQGDPSYVRNLPRHPQRDPNQDSMELTSLQNKVYRTALRLAKYHGTLEQHLSSSGAPTSVLDAVEGLKEIAEMLKELGRHPFEVETAIEAIPSPYNSPPSSPDQTIAPANVTPRPAAQTKPHSPYSAKIGKMNRRLDVELVEMKYPCDNRETSKSNFVLPNPLRCENRSPQRDTVIHRNYRGLLGEGKIFARIKQ